MNMRGNDVFKNSRGEYDLRGIDSDMEDYMSRSGYHNMTDSGFETAKASMINGQKKAVVRTVGGESFTEDYDAGSDFESVRVHNYQ